MPLVSIDDLSIGFRGPPLLDGVSATIDAGPRRGVGAGGEALKGVREVGSRQLRAMASLVVVVAARYSTVYTL